MPRPTHDYLDTPPGPTGSRATPADPGPVRETGPGSPRTVDQRRASYTRLNGVSPILRKRLKPASVHT